MGYQRKAGIQTSYGDWDWIIIDCPPTLEIFTRNALRVSRYLVVPVEVHYLGLTGLSQMIKTVESVVSLNPDIEISAVIPSVIAPLLNCMEYS